MTKLSIINSHPNDKNISFIEKTHTYYVKGKQIPHSVTEFVHSYFPKFKADEIIMKMMMSSNWENSKYYGMDAEEIKQEWDDIAKQASELGTKLHKAIENFYNNNPTPQDTEEYNHFEIFQKQHNNLKPYRTEWEIYDEKHQLAGSIDMVFEDESGNYHLYDWKRSKEIKENNKYEQGMYPVSHLPHANYWHYSLQLNIYKYILEKNYGLKINDLYIVQFHPNQDNYNKIQCVDLSDEVTAMFKDRLEELEMLNN